jgi:Fe-S cluster assembly scaffold protein SufB
MSEARSLYRRYKNTGQDTSVPREVRERLATALMDYYDSLYQYHQDDQRVKQAWEEYDIEKIERFDAETVEIDV